jgi:tRNA (guanine-N7-)-methyltransferase
MTGDHPSRSTEGFFGRRRGKTLRPLQSVQLDALKAAALLDLDQPASGALATLFAVPVTSVHMEIGFGGGEHLHHRCGLLSQTGFIGVEPFVNSLAKFAMALDADPRPNIRVYDDDATRVLDWLPPASLDGIDLLYPDPWPKLRHHKRRFVNQANLDRFARVMRPGARFRFASDIDHYINWTLLHCRAHAAFEWTAEGPDDWRKPYENWPGTRYEAKALREGRTPAYLTFRRV